MITPLRIVFWLILSVLLLPQTPQGRDCPSHLQSSRWEPRDWLALGAELRVFYLGGHLGDGLPKSNAADPWSSDPAGGLRLSASVYPLDTLTIAGELDLISAGTHLRPTQALVEYDGTWLTVTGGLQQLTFGAGAILEQRFVALDLKLKPGPVTVEAFGGLTNRLLTKSAQNCMFAGYTSHTQSWRMLSEDLLENYVAGAVVSLEQLLEPFNLQGLYLLSWPGAPELRSHGVSLSFTGPILDQYLTFSLEPLLLVDQANQVLPALITELRSRPLRGLELRLGSALSFRQGQTFKLRPIYENLSWSPLQRFNLNQGHVLRGAIAYRLTSYLRPSVSYHFRFQQLAHDDPETGDELNVGLELSLSRLYQLRASYVAVNLAGPHQPSHLCFLELRLILGPQLNKEEAP